MVLVSTSDMLPALVRRPFPAHLDGVCLPLRLHPAHAGRRRRPLDTSCFSARCRWRWVRGASRPSALDHGGDRHDTRSSRSTNLFSLYYAAVSLPRCRSLPRRSRICSRLQGPREGKWAKVGRRPARRTAEISPLRSSGRGRLRRRFAALGSFRDITAVVRFYRTPRRSPARGGCFDGPSSLGGPSCLQDCIASRCRPARRASPRGSRLPATQLIHTVAGLACRGAGGIALLASC